MAEVTIEEQSAKLEAYETGFLAVHLINTGVVLGLFKELTVFAEGLRPDALAKELGLHVPYVKGWCQTACHFGILDCDEEGRFRLAPHMHSLLTDAKNPYYFGHRARFMVSHIAEDLKRHPAFYRSGKRHLYEDHGEEFSKDARALTAHIVPLAYKFMIIPSIPTLKERLEAGMNVLDVGCGSGHLMIELAQAFSRCKFTGVEADRFAVRDVKKYVEQNGLQDRISVVRADAGSIDYRAEFDLVNMALVLHEIRPEVRARAVANCYRALKEGGDMVIFDFAYPGRLEDFRNAQYAPGIKDQFYELILGHEHLPCAARHQLLFQVGFKDPTTIPLFGGPVEVTYAKK